MAGKNGERTLSVWRAVFNCVQEAAAGMAILLSFLPAPVSAAFQKQHRFVLSFVGRGH